MGKSLKVVALVTGQRSQGQLLFNVTMRIGGTGVSAGHQIVALANLNKTEGYVSQVSK